MESGIDSSEPRWGTEPMPDIGRQRKKREGIEKLAFIGRCLWSGQCARAAVPNEASREQLRLVTVHARPTFKACDMLSWYLSWASTLVGDARIIISPANIIFLFFFRFVHKFLSIYSFRLFVLFFFVVALMSFHRRSTLARLVIIVHVLLWKCKRINVFSIKLSDRTRRFFKSNL